MASYYLDTSALIKLYVEEEGTGAILDLLKGIGGDQIAILLSAGVNVRVTFRPRTPIVFSNRSIGTRRRCTSCSLPTPP